MFFTSSKMVVTKIVQLSYFLGLVQIYHIVYHTCKVPKFLSFSHSEMKEG